MIIGAMPTVADLKKGEQGRVLSLAKTDMAYRRKLLAMGLTPGVVFEVTRVAPLGDPLEISVRGYQLSLRKKEAAIIQVEECYED